MTQSVEALVYTFEEVVDVLRSSKYGIRELMNRTNHPLPVIRNGRRITFSRDAVRQWLQEESRSEEITEFAPRLAARRRAAR